MKILFATGNEHKLTEASDILAPYGYDVRALLINGRKPKLIEPQADEIEEVALSKLDHALSLIEGKVPTDSIVLVEDSGLLIDYLDGFPGPYSSYVQSTIGLPGILSLMAGISNRGAEYKAVAVASFDGEITIAKGICRGKIAKSELGTMGFGFDPIFIPDEGDGRTYAEMSSVEKSTISHRAMALKVVSETLEPPSK